MTLHRYTQYGFDGPYWERDEEEEVERPEDISWDDRPDEDDEGYWDEHEA